jgi:hypothetical protein
MSMNQFAGDNRKKNRSKRKILHAKQKGECQVNLNSKSIQDAIYHSMDTAKEAMVSVQ